MKTTAFFLSMLLTISGVVSAQQKPTTGYAPVSRVGTGSDSDWVFMP